MLQINVQYKIVLVFIDFIDPSPSTYLQTQRHWMLRGMFVLFLAGLLVALLALLVGIVGCYQRSAKLVGWTAMMFLLSGTLLSGNFRI